MAVSPTTSSIGSSLIGTLAAPGVGSGLDVNSIVSKLMQVESLPLTALATKEAGVQAQVSAFGSLKGVLASLQTAVSGLASASAFQTQSATSSDTTVLAASAKNSAIAGSYSVSVSNLAQSQSLYAAGVTDVNAAIGSGASTTLQFQFGSISGGTLTNGKYSGASFNQDSSQGTKTVTISSSNNTLTGIRDAINAAGIGVTATIVNDGSAAPYRLSLTSTNAGAKSSMKITASGDAAIAGLMGYDAAGTQNFTQSAAALNASLSVNGLAVTSATNTVSDAIQGVTLNLANAGTSTVTISPNATGLQSTIEKFVTAYNSTASEIGTLTSYNATTRTAGQLLGDATTLRIQSSLRNLVTSPVPGASSSGPTMLAQIGINYQLDGTLAIDQTKLQNALNSNPGSVAGLFAAMGKPSDALVSYISSSTATQPGNYQISVSALATQGNVTSSLALGSSTTIDASNDTLGLTVDGSGATLSIAHGSYTPDQLAAALQSAINGASTLSAASASVSVKQTGGVLSATSTSYGAKSSVILGNGNALASLFGAPTSTAGTDVVGTINGVSATGYGQTLTGASGDASAGLQVRVTGGTTGSRGSIAFSRGVGDSMNTLLNNYLDSNNGAIAASTNELQSEITDITNQTTALNVRLADIQARYQAQFAALDTLLASMNSTSTFLTQQLANLPSVTGQTK